MTKGEFETRYAERSGTTVERLRELGQFAAPCDCGEEGCEGWQMVSKIPVSGHMRVNAYEVLSRAVEEGIGYGWMRAHKHTDKPSEDAIKEQIERGVMNSICEVFEFEPL